MAGISKFTDLTTWQTAHQLVIKLLKLLKPSKSYNPLIDQMSRAAISITSNIAEGFGRESLKDARHFYIIARGSLVELQNQLLLAKDTGRIADETFKVVAEQTVLVHKLVNGILRTLKNNQQLTTSNKSTSKKN